MFHCLQKPFSANFAEPWGELASRLASEIAKFFVHQQFGCDHFSFHFLFTHLLMYQPLCFRCLVRVFLQRLGYICNKKEQSLLVLLGSQFLKRLKLDFW